MAHTILLVDDSKTIRMVLQMHLSRAGYALLSAATGTDAVAVAQEQQPDLIVLDHQLPGCDGPEVCARLSASERTSRIPIVVASGGNATQMAAYNPHGNVRAKLRKPFVVDDLLATVQRVLREHEAAPPAPAANRLHHTLHDLFDPDDHAHTNWLPVSDECAEPDPYAAEPHDAPPVAAAPLPSADELVVVVLDNDHHRVEHLRTRLTRAFADQGIAASQWRFRVAATMGLARVLLSKFQPAAVLFASAYDRLIANSHAPGQAPIYVAIDHACALAHANWTSSVTDDQVAATIELVLQRMRVHS